MKNTLVFVAVVQSFFVTGCVSDINSARLNINLDTVKNPAIVQLKNGNDDLNLNKIGSQVMERSGFLTGNEQSYGYYAVDVRDTCDKAPNFFMCGWVNGLTLFVPSLIGFPTDISEFALTAYFYIFDSNGTVIKVYKNSDSFEKLAGLYYGQNPNKKASRYYSKLFKEILEYANSQSEEINYLLEQAGPITNENSQSANEKTTEFFHLLNK